MPYDEFVGTMTIYGRLLKKQSLIPSLMSILHNTQWKIMTFELHGRGFDLFIKWLLFYRVSEKKLCNEKVPLLDVNRNQMGMKHISMSQMESWLLNAVYSSQFGCCKPEISRFFQEKSRNQLCHFSMNGTK